jgi:hypothetical protein
MNKTWQFRVCALYLTVGLPLAASCAREANTLEDEISGSGGSSHTVAGSSTKAGTGSTAGSSSAFGGTSSTAGKGGGGKAGAVAGDGGEAPSAGTGGTAGSGGTGVPPDVLARASAVVEYQTEHVMASDGTIQMKLYVVNQSADDLPMANVKIRYWFTAEVMPTLYQYYVADQLKPTQAVFVNEGANSHALLTFGNGAIKKGGDIALSEIQLEIKNNTAKFDQADDFSWAPTSTTHKPNDKITLYLEDKLIWGCEPSGACFDDGVGAGGAGGMPGAGGEPAAGGEPSAGGMPGVGGEPGGAGGLP